MHLFPKGTITYIIILAVMLIAWTTGAQEMISGKRYQPIATKSFGIEDGLFWNCVLTVNIEDEGILGIVPCIHVQNTQGLYFFLFDGFESYGLNPPQIKEKSSSVLVPVGFNKRDNLYGFIGDRREYPRYTEYFEFDQEEGKWNSNFITTENNDTLLIYNVKEENESLFFVGTLDGKTVIFERSVDSDKISFLVDSVEVQRPTHARNALLITKDYIWTKNWKNTVRRISKRTGDVESYELPITNEFSPVVPDKIFEGPDHRIFATLHVLGKVFEFKKDLNRFVPYEVSISKDFISKNIYCYQDEKLQLLFVHQSEQDHLRSYILRENVNKDDYSNVSQYFPSNPFSGLRNVDLFSKDFEEELFVLGSNFISIEVQAIDAVEAVSASDARSFFYAEDDQILVSAAGLYDLKTKQLISPENKYCTGQDLRGESDIIRLPNGEIVRGMLNAQLNFYNPETKNCKVVDVPGDITRMLLENEENILAVAGKRLGRISLTDYQWTPILNDEIPGFLNAIERLDDGSIILASSAGLFVLQASSKKLEKIDIGGQSDEQQILCIYSVDSTKVLLGTFRQGLKIWDRKNQSFSQIDQADGLSNNTIAAIEVDSEGFFWLGTFDGIAIIDPQFNLIGHIYELDGLIDNECNRWSSGKLRDGRLFFGTPEGFSLIQADIIKKTIANRPQPVIYLTQIKFDEQILRKGQSTFDDTLRKHFVLPASNRNLNLSYSLSSYASLEQNTFEYKIDREGYDWNFVGPIHNLNISNLPSGKYNILLRGTDFRGRQSANMLTVPIFVKEYFYKTWWFTFLSILVLLCFLAAWAIRQRDENRRLETEVAKRTKTIQEQAEDLRELDKAKTRLFTNISHEFRTPLTVILGLADKSQEDSKAPEIIKRNASNLLSLVNQILDLRKLESGKLELSMIQADINRYLAYISESMKSLAESNSLQFHYLAPQVPIIMDFDPDKLMKIVVNLISNAVKFTPAGGNIYVQLEQFDLPEKHISFKVKDTGIGIDANDHAKIFNRFHQLDLEKETLNKTQFQGTGIGLTLVKTLVDLMDGEIVVESRSGKGSTFTVKLPVHNTANVYEPASQGLAMTKQERISGRTPEFLTDPDLKDAPLVLVVDDNPDILHYVQSCLQSVYNIALAQNGQEGIEKAIELVPDLIISDVMMPLKDGLELCETLKNDKRTSHIPIILLTAKADIESKLVGLSRGADAYLAKPFHERELLLNIKKLIALRENLRQRYSSEHWMDKQSEDLGIKMEDGFILRFREILLENIENEDWSVSDMNQAMLVSRTQLHNKIRSLTGRSVSQFMRSIRLQEARRIMKNGELNISQVAYKVGFRDPKYFSRVFKEEYGQTPSEWASS